MVPRSFVAYAVNPTSQEEGSWIPIPALNRTDADVSLFLLMPNSIIYNDPTFDPLFQATTPRSIAAGTNGENITYYEPDRQVNVLSCMDQFQFCNPTKETCTPLIAFSAISEQVLVDPQLGLNAAQLNTANHIGLAIPGQLAFDIVDPRGPNSLIASESVVDNRNFAALPPTQWMREVDNWFGVSMAKLQHRIVELATGPDVIPENVTLQLTAPLNKWQKHICNNQKIRSSSDTMSFSVLGVAIILVVGAAIIFTNLVLDTLVGFIRRKMQWKDFKRLQWILDEKLQLQRLAYEEAGQGQWSGGTDAVPVTTKGQTFGMPKHVDRLHPRLGQRPGVQETAYFIGSGGPEEDGLIDRKGADATVSPVR